MGLLFVLFLAGIFIKSAAQQSTVPGANQGSAPPAATNHIAVPLTVDPFSGLSLTAKITLPATNKMSGIQVVTTPQIVGAAPALETLQPVSARQIVSAPGGAVANYAAHKVGFAENVNNVPALDFAMPGGAELSSHILGLCYYGPNGESVLFAPLKDSQGQIQPPNQILYADSFLGASADVIYTYTDSSMEQDIIIRKQLPSPAKFGLDPATARLAVLTEFFNPVQPALRPVSLDLTPFNLALGITGDDALADQLIVFNTMRIGKGRAFTLGDSGQDIPVGKSWQNLGGRTFLVECAPYSLLKKQLDALPVGTAQITPRKKESFRTALLSAPLPSRNAVASGPMRLAEGIKQRPGVVLDYLITSAPILNVEFASTGKTGYAAVGQTTNDYWNSYSAPNYSNFTVTNLLWSSSNASGASITVSNAPGQGSLPVSDPMYRNYIFASGGSIGLTISNLPSGTYDFFVYGHGNTNNQNGIYQLTSAGTSPGAKATATNSLAWTNTNWQEGEQFVTFRNVFVTNTQPVYLVAQINAGGFGIINGLQIVPDNPRTNITSLLNIDVNDGTLSPEVGPAAVGLTTNDFWNAGGLGGQGNEAPITDTHLRWSDGFVSPVSFTIFNAPGCWGFTTPDLMYFGYSYCWDGQPVVMTISNLANGRYDFYVYGHGYYAAMNGIFQLSTWGSSYGTLSTATTGTNWQASTGNWQEGQQYVVFRDVWVTNNQPVILTSLADSQGVALVNGLQIVQPMPSDNTYSTSNGIPDWWLLQYGFNPHDPTVAFADPDYDGRNNLQEYLDGTIPTNSGSVSNVMLAYFPFDAANWAGNRGQVPISSSGVQQVPSWSTNAALVDGPNPGVLTYHDVEANGVANINCRNGTVSFWYKPDWTSSSLGGTGPQDYGYLISLGGWAGNAQYGLWDLSFDPGGNNVRFEIQGNGVGVQPIVQPIIWSSNVWHQVVLTYSPTASQLYLDGQLAAPPGSGATEYPALAVRALGFSIGNASFAGSTNLALPTYGAFDELRTYNYVLSAASVSGSYQAAVTNFPPVILQNPSNAAVLSGQAATFTVIASCPFPLAYQWTFNGTNLAGATNATLTLTNVLANQEGDYAVEVSNLAGMVTSAPATLVLLGGGYASPTGSLTNFTFRSDSTSYINSNLTLYGITTIEGGAVIKFGTNPLAQIIINGTNLVCQTAPFHPALFTGQDDDSVGVRLPWSTGNPTNYYGGGLVVGSVALKNVRFSYAATALSISNNALLDLSDAQFVNCQNVFNAGGGSTSHVKNALLCSIGNLVAATSSFKFNGEQLTVDQCNAFVAAGNAGAAITLTNTILVGVTTWNGCSYAPNSWVVATSATNVFQVVGAGSHYLAPNSPYQGAGTTNISPTTLADIQQRTTQPPLVLSNTFTANITLSPEVFRDINSSPDLGYHYAPIDFLSSWCQVSNATVLLTNGVVFAYYNSASLWLGNGAQLVSQGTPNQNNVFVYYRLVQEQATNLWGWSTNNASQALYNSQPFNPWTTNFTNFPGISLRFTTLNAMNGEWWLFGTGDTYNGVTNLFMRDCEIYAAGAWLVIDNTTLTPATTFENNLFHRPGLLVAGGIRPISMINNLFVGDGGTITPVTIYTNNPAFPNTNLNNAFDGCQVYLDSLRSNNAYLNSTLLMMPPEASSITTTMTWIAGPLGNYYQATNSPLIDKGSTTADQLGLYHYTTQTNQVPETNSIVDIGYHYIALGANGLPLSTSGDGIGDYIKDANGNGGTNQIGDMGNWRTNTTCSGGVNDYIRYLQGQNLNLCTTSNDTSGVLGLQVYTPLK